MKAFITVILLSLFALIGTYAVHSDVATTATSKVCTVQDIAQSTTPTAIDEAVLLPRSMDKGIADMEVGDAHTLAHRISASAERMYRFSSIETAHFIRTLLRRMAIRMANLTNCYIRVYDTSRFFSWNNACEHYIFEMRRILI